MINAIVNTLEELGFVCDKAERMALLALSERQLMKEFIFPKCLCLPRAGFRYPRISGRFMLLMVKHGRDFIWADYELGSILLECAMQRISKHPDLPAIDYQGILPEGYKQYAASVINPDGLAPCPDEPGLWGSDEVRFIVEMLPMCLQLKDARFAGHARLILFQLLTRLGAQQFQGDFSWIDDPCFCYLSQEKVWDHAVGIMLECNLVREMIDLCVENNWRCGLKLFSSWCFYGQDVDYLLSKIDLEQETYYRGFKRFILKSLGLYGKKTKKKILEEISCFIKH